MTGTKLRAANYRAQIGSTQYTPAKWSSVRRVPYLATVAGVRSNPVISRFLSEMIIIGEMLDGLLALAVYRSEEAALD